MKKILALSAVLVPFAFAACTSTDDNQDMKSMSMADATEMTLDVTGMTWGAGCPPQVRSALGSVDGVESVDVDYTAKTATVKLNGPVDAKALLTALEDAGFGGTMAHWAFASKPTSRTIIEMKTTLLAAFAAATLGLAACTAETAETPAPAPAETPSAGDQATTPKAALVSFKVEGMTWGAGCPPKVTSAVAKGLGVPKDKINVNYETKEVTVDVDKESCDMTALASALEDGGYSIKM